MQREDRIREWSTALCEKELFPLQEREAKLSGKLLPRLQEEVERWVMHSEELEQRLARAATSISALKEIVRRQDELIAEKDAASKRERETSEKLERELVSAFGFMQVEAVNANSVL